MIDPMLQPGEQLVAAAHFQSKGAATGAGGLAGMAVQAVRSKGDRAAAAAAGMELPTRGIFAITDQRALILTITAWLGKPKAISSEIPTTNLVSAELAGKSLNAAVKRMKLTFSTGGTAEIDIFKKDGPDEMVAALNGIAGR